MQSSTAVVGFVSGVAATMAVVVYDAVQLTQIAGLLRFPLDETLIYTASLCIDVPFLLAMLALHHLTERRRQFWSHGALLFTVIYVVFVVANYVVQLATVIPAKLAGAIDAVVNLEQTPHSLFWDFDAIGYVAMGAASLLAAIALDGAGFERRVRYALFAHAAVTPLIGIVYFHPRYSPDLLWLGLPWAVTAPIALLMLALHLRTRPVVA